MKNLKHTLIAILSLCSVASRPIFERSEERCHELLKNSKSAPVQWLSTSSLIPLSTLLGSTKAPIIAKYWLEGDRYARQFPTPGQVQMFQTANLAANEIIEKMNLVTVAPVYDKNNLIDGIRATLDLMRSDKSPKYIRNGILIRDGIFMVVPILKLSKTKSGKRTYVPMIAKGHQELEKFDVLSAAFAAWMVEFWMKAIPDEADIYLRPMAEKRKARVKDQIDLNAIYKIKPEDYSLRIHQIHENFMKLVTDPEKLETTQPHRNTQLGKSAWSTFSREQMKAAKDLSMMPFPPKLSQIETLGVLGYGDMEKLATLDVNSEEFVRVSLTTGITPPRLRYYVAHAIAFMTDAPIVIEPLEEDPFKSSKKIVHIDFEDVINPKVKSGVYLFGSEIQDQKVGSRSLLESFIFAEALDQPSIDEAWAKFFRFLKNEPLLKDGNYLITMYSKHELVKIEQELDILKQPADEFTPAEKASPYYSEFKVKISNPYFSSSPPREKTYGRLIRRKEFFKKYPDIKPAQVFDVISKLVDLLDIVRWNTAFPTYSNGIKSIQKYVSTLRYDKGANGLASLAKAAVAYQTGEEAKKEEIRLYNKMDIDMDRFISDFLRALAGSPVYAKIKWTDKTEKTMEELMPAVQARRAADSILERKRMLEQILGRPVSSLSETDILKLMLLLDRSAYLKKLQSFSDNKELTEEEIEAAKQFEKFTLENERQHVLMEFFTTHNPEINKNPDSLAAAKLVDLIDSSSQYLTPKQIMLILAYERLENHAPQTSAAPRKDLSQISTPPESYMAVLDGIRMDDILSEVVENDTETSFKVGKKELQRLWAGIYYQRVFAPKKP